MASKINTYNDLNIKELNEQLNEKKNILFNMRFQKALQQLSDPIAIKNIKKEIARIKTRINSLNKVNQKS